MSLCEDRSYDKKEEICIKSFLWSTYSTEGISIKWLFLDIKVDDPNKKAKVTWPLFLPFNYEGIFEELQNT